MGRDRKDRGALSATLVPFLWGIIYNSTHLFSDFELI